MANEKVSKYETIISDLVSELMEAADKDYVDQIIPEIFASATADEMRRFGLEDYIEDDDDDEDEGYGDDEEDDDYDG